MTWVEQDHPRWPAEAPGGRGGEFRGSGTSPGGWLQQASNAGLLRGFMNHDQLHSYLHRTDFTEQQIHGGNSGYTGIRTYSDGTQLVSKQHDSTYQADNEVRASYIGWAVGAPVPAVIADPNHEDGTLSQYIHGKTAAAELVAVGLNPMRADDAAANLADGLEGSYHLGIFDLLIGNEDRHPGNWIITPDGRAVGIDHGDANVGWLPDTTGPFVDMILDDNGHFRPHRFSIHEITSIWYRLDALREQHSDVMTQDELERMQSMLMDLRDAYQ